MSPTGISTLRLRDVDNSTTAAAVEMRIASRRKAIARTVAEKGKKKRREPERQSENPNGPLTRPDRRADHTWADKRIVVCCLMPQGVARRNTVAGTTTEVTEFAASSCTQAAMAMKTISKLRRNARAFATMLLVFAI